ncbi:putative receptor-like protein kinase [Panicum miliaceum]|uniref:Receptor-like protein kinase n=1 Tax=Panicum miliaceum TaxID=4540 RepID=A0A3L6RXM3_PANMI|nr:putative receptor-like protein kinase [Panicum miliaceum]
MEGKTAKILAGAAAVVLVALELSLFLCFRLSRPFYLSTAVILSVVLAGIVAALLCHALSPRGRAERMARRPVLDGGEEVSVRVEYSFFRKVAGLPSRFSLEALAVATDDFQCVVGRGSSGTVFKGILDDGTAVAVKRIDGSAYVDKEFRAEVSAIGSVQHVSLVRLLGFCLVRNGPRFLVYEFMENGSLDKWIFPQHGGGGGGRCLTWLQRYQVAVDVAKALAYLHHDCRAKAEPGPGGSRRWTYLPKLVADKAREGRVMEVLDRRLAPSSVDEAGVRRLAHVALWCAQEKAGARPTMARVVEMLEARGGAAVEPPPPSDMIVVDLLALDPAAHEHRGGGPFGLPTTLPRGSAGTASSVASMSDSFALSYLSGR